MTQALEQRFHENGGNPIFLPKIRYLAPHHSQQNAVVKFLADCLQTAKLT